MVDYNLFGTGVTLQGTLNANLKVTYEAQGSGTVWNYQWYFRPENSRIAQPVPGANASHLIVESVGCAQQGDYLVQVNCGGGGAGEPGIPGSCGGVPGA